MHTPDTVSFESAPQSTSQYIDFLNSVWLIFNDDIMCAEYNVHKVTHDEHQTDLRAQ